MTTKRNLHLDRKNTLEKILDKSQHPPKDGANWLGHRLTSGGANIDALLLKGEHLEKLRAIKIGSTIYKNYENHKVHLLRDHGLRVIEDDDKCKFDVQCLKTGLPHSHNRPLSHKKIQSNDPDNNIEEYVSWAIWDPNDKYDTTIIDRSTHELKNSVVMVGLNIGLPIKGRWQNYHGGRHDHKIIHAFNDSSYRGAYMTDLFKGVYTTESSNIRNMVKDDEKFLERHMGRFLKEINDVGATKKSLFIIFGAYTAQLFNDNLKIYFPNVVYCHHYSDWSWTDAKWVSTIWDQLISHYNKTKEKYDTLEFKITDTMEECLRELEKKEERNKNRKQKHPK